jgi:hypothetical protein
MSGWRTWQGISAASNAPHLLQAHRIIDPVAVGSLGDVVSQRVGGGDEGIPRPLRVLLTQLNVRAIIA